MEKSALPQRPALKKKIPHWTQLVKRLAWRAVVAAFCSSARKASQTGKHQTIPLKEAYGIWAWVNVTKWCHYEHTIFIFTGDDHHGFPWPLRFRHDLGHPGAGAAALLGTRQLAHPGTFDAGLPGRQILLPLFRSSAQYIQCIATKNITKKTWPRVPLSKHDSDCVWVYNWYVYMHLASLSTHVTWARSFTKHENQQEVFTGYSIYDQNSLTRWQGPYDEVIHRINSFQTWMTVRRR